MANLLSVQAEDLEYDPNNLFNTLIKQLNLKNDAALAKLLDISPPVISKVRHRSIPVGATLLIRMHEISDVSIKDLRGLMGDRRAKFSAVSQQPHFGARS